MTDEDHSSLFSVVWWWSVILSRPKSSSRSPINQRNRGDGRDPWQRHSTLLSLPACKGFFRSPIISTDRGGTGKGQQYNHHFRCLTRCHFGHTGLHLLSWSFLNLSCSIQLWNKPFAQCVLGSGKNRQGSASRQSQITHGVVFPLFPRINTSSFKRMLQKWSVVLKTSLRVSSSIKTLADTMHVLMAFMPISWQSYGNFNLLNSFLAILVWPTSSSGRNKSLTRLSLFDGSLCIQPSIQCAQVIRLQKVLWPAPKCTRSWYTLYREQRHIVLMA